MIGDTDGWGFKLPVGTWIRMEKNATGHWTAMLSSGCTTLIVVSQPRLVGLVQALLEQARKDGVIP